MEHILTAHSPYIRTACYKIGPKQWRLRLYVNKALKPFITTINSEAYPDAAVRRYACFAEQAYLRTQNILSINQNP